MLTHPLPPSTRPPTLLPTRGRPDLAMLALQQTALAAVAAQRCGLVMALWGTTRLLPADPNGLCLEELVQALDWPLFQAGTDVVHRKGRMDPTAALLAVMFWLQALCGCLLPMLFVRLRLDSLLWGRPGFNGCACSDGDGSSEGGAQQKQQLEEEEHEEEAAEEEAAISLLAHISSGSAYSRSSGSTYSRSSGGSPKSYSDWDGLSEADLGRSGWSSDSSSVDLSPPPADLVAALLRFADEQPASAALLLAEAMWFLIRAAAALALPLNA